MIETILLIVFGLGVIVVIYAVADGRRQRKVNKIVAERDRATLTPQPLTDAEARDLAQIKRDIEEDEQVKRDLGQR